MLVMYYDPPTQREEAIHACSEELKELELSEREMARKEASRQKAAEKELLYQVRLVRTLRTSVWRIYPHVYLLYSQLILTGLKTQSCSWECLKTTWTLRR